MRLVSKSAADKCGEQSSLGQVLETEVERCGRRKERKRRENGRKERRGWENVDAWA